MFESTEQRIEAFGKAIDALRREVEADLGEKDAQHIRNIGRVSDGLEVLGRSLIHFSFEPAFFGLGVGALWAHKCLELMEIGHMALHGAYDKLDGAERFHEEGFHWKAPIDEESWRTGHNIRHHQYTNVDNRDPDVNFGFLRLTEQVTYHPVNAFQPYLNFLTWTGFATGINLHVTGVLEIFARHRKPLAMKDRSSKSALKALRSFTSKFARYYGREYVFFPALAGPFFLKTLLGNVLSEVGRDLYAGATIYCGHVGAKDYPEGTRAKGRAQWYRMQAESARNIKVPKVLSILCGGLDLQIEHHLFPRLPPNRLREVAPKVQAICEAHGVTYLQKGWPETLRDVFVELKRLSVPNAIAMAAE